MSDEKPEDGFQQAHNKRYADIARARIRQLTGKQYPRLEQQLDKLTGEALMDLARLVDDMQSEVTRAKRQAIHQPWRR